MHFFNPSTGRQKQANLSSRPAWPTELTSRTARVTQRSLSQKTKKEKKRKCVYTKAFVFCVCQKQHYLQQSQIRNNTNVMKKKDQNKQIKPHKIIQVRALRLLCIWELETVKPKKQHRVAALQKLLHRLESTTQVNEKNHPEVWECSSVARWSL